MQIVHAELAIVDLLYKIGTTLHNGGVSIIVSSVLFRPGSCFKISGSSREEVQGTDGTIDDLES